MPASLNTSLAKDYKVVDSLASATLTSRSASGSTTTSLTFVSASDIGSREIAAAGGFYQQGDRRFLIPGDQVSGATLPKPGDAITFDSAEYELLDAVLDAFGVSWECTGRKAR